MRKSSFSKASDKVTLSLILALIQIFLPFCSARIFCHPRDHLGRHQWPFPQVPNVVSFKMNATLSVSQAAPQDSMDTLSFPIFSAGHRRSRRSWVNSTEDLPEGVRDKYTAAQTKLLCTAQVCLLACSSAL